MAKAIVQCRICKEKFDRLDKSLIEGIDYVKPSNRMYYHKKCYDEYQESKRDIHATMGDDVWFNAMWEFLTKELKYSFNFVKVKNQWNNFLKNKMTAKGIYFAIKYFYDVKKNDASKSENGIGIIPHIYADSREYWEERERREAGICAAIEQQILEASKQKTVMVKIEKPKRKVFNPTDRFAAIEDMEDDE